MDKLVFLDIESTGLDTDTAEIIELCYITEDGNRSSKLYKPVSPIPPHVSGINNIDNVDVENEEHFQNSSAMYDLRAFAASGYIAVTHNTEFDLGMLKQFDINFEREICTCMLAKYLWPTQIQNHQLGTLRAYLDIPHSGNAHRAEYDVQILIEIFSKMRENHFHSLDEMVEKTRETRAEIDSVWHFGKHYGEKIDVKIHRSYIEWLLKQPNTNPQLRKKLQKRLQDN